MVKVDVSLGPSCVTENLIAMTGQMKLTLTVQVRILSLWKESNFVQNRHGLASSMAFGRCFQSDDSSF